MPAHGRALLFLIALAGAGPAAAQLGYDPLIVANDSMPWIPSRQAPPPDFRMNRGDLREAPGPARGGLIAALPIRENVTLGVGRFASSAPRPRSHVEPEPRPGELRHRERGVAAVGVSIRF
jgi:hypothetical protein